MSNKDNTTGELESGESYFERYRRVKDELPEQYRDAYERLTGSGRRGIDSLQAAVEYAETPKIQSTVADEYGVTRITLRRTLDDLIRLGAVDIEHVRSNTTMSGKRDYGRSTNNDERDVTADNEVLNE